MYYVLMGIQIFSLFLGLYCIGRLAFIKGSVDSKFLLIATILAEIYGVGYVKEMLATSPDESMAATGFQYVGFGYLAFVYTQFIFRYVHIDHKVPKWVWGLIYAFDSLIVTLALTSKYHSHYYSSTQWVTTGLYPHLVKGKTPLYWMFLASEMILLLVCSIVVLYRANKAAGKIEKKRLYFVFIETLIPIPGVILNVTDVLRGFDMNSMMILIMITVMSVTLLSGTMFDIINLAHEDYFESTNIANIVIDSENQYIDSNEQAKLIFPELANCEPGTPLKEFGVDNIEKRDGVDFERNGFYYHAIYEELKQKKGTIGYIISISNVTDSYKQMENMRELKEKADSANTAKSRYLANMSHELRTPLNAIIGMTEIAHREPSISRMQEYVSQIKSSGLILLDIINDVLDFSKAESGKLEIIEGEYDFGDMINSVVNITNVRVNEKPINLYVDIDPSIPRRLVGDEVRIRQIFMNILGNAAKYTREGYIELTIDQESAEDGIFLRILVEDSGIGIKKEDIKKIFDPFQQVDLQQNKKIEGSGLGLAITRELIQLMDGELDIQSEYGSGTRFYIKLYQGIATDDTISQDSDRRKIAVEKNKIFSIYGLDTAYQRVQDDDYRHYPDAKVLVVDDNEVNLYVAKGLLRIFGIECDTADGGRSCINKVKEQEYDLILMDHLMPEMDGIEATVLLYQKCEDRMKDTAVVACTANVDKKIQSSFYEAGMKDYISKPLMMEDLDNILKRYLS